MFSVIIILFTLLIDELIAEITVDMENTYEINFFNEN
tara:strand:+ start:367 stop:477 length:111 start_codon:yes stop_codon:yes gene_type:complete